MSDSRTSPSRCSLVAPGRLRRRAADLRWRAGLAGRGRRPLGLVRRVRGTQIREWRRGPVRHPLALLVRQRVFQIACGYEDQDDADTLRHDPLLKLVCGRRPHEPSADLASQPTFSRLENAVDRRACYRLAARAGGGLPAGAGTRAGGAPDARAARPGQHRRPDARRAGGQRLPRLLPPAHVPPPARLRRRHRPAHHRRPAPRQRPRQPRRRRRPQAPGRRAARALAARRHRAARRQRLRHPRALRLLRARAASPTPSGWSPTPAWRRWPPRCWPQATAAAASRPGAKVRLAGEAQLPRRVAGPTRAGWSTRPRRWRRAATPASWSPPAPTAPLALYDWYVDRGEPENWIKDLKDACFADRLSCHRFWANQFRLLLHAAAYWLLDTLRRWLLPAGGRAHAAGHAAAAPAQDRRLGRASCAAPLSLHLASSHPGEPLWHLLAARLTLRE